MGRELGEYGGAAGKDGVGMNTWSIYGNITSTHASEGQKPPAGKSANTREQAE